MKLQPSEKDLVGKWITQNGTVQADAACARIDWLLANHLKKVAASKKWGDWETLYQDPDDGRYWERTFPQSEMNGGGPPRLAVLSAEQARAKYQLV